MSDPQLEALITQLEGMQGLLITLAVGDQQAIRDRIEGTIADLRRGASRAKTEKERQELATTVAALANSVSVTTRASIDLSNAVKSGDPYAISASTLDLATSLVSMVGAATGPIGAAAAAVLGAVLSLVSMILKLFVKEPPSLLEQIEEMIRKIESETKLQHLQTTRDAISSFSAQALEVKEGTKYTFDQLVGMLNPVEGNAISRIREAEAWLAEPNNGELPLWGEVLAVLCQTYLSYKLSLAHWLPHMKDTPEENASEKLINAFASNDALVLKFLERIKPAARNRGIIWHSGLHSLYVRDVVHSTKDLKALGGSSGAIFTVSNRNGETSPNPYLTIFRLKSESPGTFDLKHPFTQNGRVEDLDGQWPLHNHSKWEELRGVEECSDIWVTTGEEKGEINLYTVRGGKIAAYIHNRKASGEHLVGAWENDFPGYKIGAIRVVHWPKFSADRNIVTGAFFDVRDREVLKNVARAHYALCEVSLDGRDRIEIKAIFHHPTTIEGNIRLPKIFPDGDSRNYPVGIAVDSAHLWVFGTSFIACATHADVKLCLQRSEYLPPWLTYEMPSEVGDYDPKAKAPMGLRDLSACDDGTLTAVFQDKEGQQRIITATTRFELNRPIIQEGTKTDYFGNTTPTHGWVMDKSVWAYRVHKQPIFCWPMIEGLEKKLQPNL